MLAAAQQRLGITSAWAGDDCTWTTTSPAVKRRTAPAATRQIFLNHMQGRPGFLAWLHLTKPTVANPAPAYWLTGADGAAMATLWDPLAFQCEASAETAALYCKGSSGVSKSECTYCDCSEQMDHGSGRFPPRAQDSKRREDCIPWAPTRIHVLFTVDCVIT